MLQIQAILISVHTCSSESHPCLSQSHPRSGRKDGRIRRCFRRLGQDIFGPERAPDCAEFGQYLEGLKWEGAYGLEGSDEAEPKCTVIAEVQNALTHNQNHTALGDDDGCLELQSDHSEESEHEEDALS